MQRRRFLAGAALGVAAFTSWRYLAANTPGAVVKILYKNLDYLRLDPDGVQRFAHDYAARPQNLDTRLKGADAAGMLYTAIPFRAGEGFDWLLRWEDRVITDFLLSSDFFAQGADVSRVVRYTGYFDPLRGCQNPFARRVDTGAA